MKGGGPILQNSVALCETSKTSWVMGKTPYARRFGESFKGPKRPFGAPLEYHPISPKDQIRVHQFGKKVLPGIFLGYALIAGGIWKRDSGGRHGRVGKVRTHQIFIFEESTRKRP